MNLFKHKNSIVILAASAAIACGMFLYGQKIHNDLLQLRESEISLFTQSRELDTQFMDFQRALGFGGFIHNVKVYLVHRSPAQLRLLEANVQELEAAYVAIHEHLQDPESAHAMITLDRFVTLVRQKLEQLLQPANQQLGTMELDRLLDIETPETLSALITLESLKNRHSTEAIAQIKTSIDKLVFDLRVAIVLLPFILVIGVYLSLLLNREIRTKQKLDATTDLLREREERLNLIIKGSNDAPWDWDLIQKKAYYSPQWWAQLGYAPDELPADVALRERLLHPEDATRVREVLSRAFESRIDSYEVEFRLQHKAGHYVPFLSRGFISRDATGTPIRVTGTNMDLTERKRLEAEKEVFQIRLQQAQKMEAIGALAGGIAHDFNNILSAIYASVDLALLYSPPESPIKEYLNETLISADRAKDLVAQILTFSRQEKVDHIPIKIPPLIKEGLKMLRSSIPTTIQITEEIDPESGTILADPTQVNQILINLCTNAYHSMEKTGGTLSIALKPIAFTADDPERPATLLAGEYVELAVSDTGEGIETNVIGKIFDPFYTTKEVGKGTGLGLSIIHSIMEECGGAITVESQHGKGATFYTYFPVVKEPVAPVSYEPEAVPRGNERVLLVDDDEVLANLGQQMLETLGYRVMAHTSSSDALTVFQDAPDAFDVVVTDQTMPKLTGTELAVQMMQIRPDIPIILCSGYSSLINEKSTLAAGIKVLASKPLTYEKLAQLIRKVLDASSNATS